MARGSVYNGRSQVLSATQSYQDEEWTRRWDFRMDDEFTDINFVVQGATFRAHRVVMATLSQHFRNLIQELAPWQRCVIMNLPFVTKEVFRAIWTYAYTGHIQISVDTVRDLLTAATHYHIPFLVKICQIFIVDRLDEANVCSVVQFACLFPGSQLYRKTISFFTRNLEVVLRTSASSLSEIAAGNLIEIFSDDHIVIGRYPVLKSHQVETLILKTILHYQTQMMLDDDTFYELLKTARLFFITEENVRAIAEYFPVLTDTNKVLRKYMGLHLCFKKAERNRVFRGPIPEAWHRKRSNFFEFVYGQRYAPHRMSLVSEPDNPLVYDKNLEINRIKFWVRKGNKDVDKLLGGIMVEYRKNGVMDPDFNYYKGSFDDGEGWEEKIIQLGELESIRKVYVWTSPDEILKVVTALCFKTSTGREIGPYGSKIGVCFAECDNTQNINLFGIICDSVRFLGATALANMVFQWMRI